MKYLSTSWTKPVNTFIDFQTLKFSFLSTTMTDSHPHLLYALWCYAIWYNIINEYNRVKFKYSLLKPGKIPALTHQCIINERSFILEGGPVFYIRIWNDVGYTLIYLALRPGRDCCMRGDVMGIF